MEIPAKMANVHGAAEQIRSDAKGRKSTPVFLVGNIEATNVWYQGIGFEARYFPPGFCILSRDTVEIFLQVHDGYVRPDDPRTRERGAWSAYIETDNVRALFDEISKRPNGRITRTPCPQPYGQIEFEVVDPNGYVLVFAQQVHWGRTRVLSRPPGCAI